MATKLDTENVLQEVRDILTSYEGKSYLNTSIKLDKWYSMSKMINEDELVAMLNQNKTDEKNDNKTDEKNDSNDSDESNDKDKKNYQDLEVFQLEKVDGSNWSIVFCVESDDDKIINVWICKRTKEIKTEKELFKGSISIVKKYSNEFQSLVKNICEYMKTETKTKNELTLTYVTVFGELYGPGVNSRIDYGMNQLDIVLYSICINGKRIKTELTLEFLNQVKLPVVPIMARGKLCDLYTKLRGPDGSNGPIIVNSIVDSTIDSTIDSTSEFVVPIDKIISPLFLRNQSILTSEHKSQNTKSKAKKKSILQFEGVVFHPVDKGPLIKCRATPFLEKLNKKSPDTFSLGKSGQCGQCGGPDKNSKTEKNSRIEITKECKDICIKYFRKEAIANRSHNYMTKVGFSDFAENIDSTMDAIILDLSSDIREEFINRKISYDDNYDKWIKNAVFRTLNNECKNIIKESNQNQNQDQNQ